MSIKKDLMKDHKSEFLFGLCFVLLFVSMGLQSGYQTDFGNIDVRSVEIRSYDGRIMAGKLYKPKEANMSNPLPAVLAIHGYNNDKDVQRPHTLELAKRGIVVLAIDCLNHGDSDKGDFVFGASSIPYEAYDWLKAQSFVNPNKTGVVGHSMGAFFALAIALKYSEIDVLGYQAFGPDDLTAVVPLLNAHKTNVIQISSSGEEFGSRQWNQTIEQWQLYCSNQVIANTAATGVGDGTGSFFKTYGNIIAGTAQRYVFIPKTHPGQTHDLVATQEITSYFLQTLKTLSETDANELVSSTTYIWADIWGTVSALVLMLSIIPLLTILLKARIFQDVAQPMPEIKESQKPKRWLWWTFASINIVVGGTVYVLCTNSPNNLSGIFDANWIGDNLSLLDMGVANGFLAFYIMSAIISIILNIAWFLIVARRQGVTAHDWAFSDKKEKFSIDLKILAKSVLIAVLIFFYMYGMAVFAKWAWSIEIRGPWSMFKEMTPSRALEFWRYYWGVLLFWIVNGGIWLFGLMRQKEHGTERKTVFIWWIKAILAMLLGLALLNAIGYLPLAFGWTGLYWQQLQYGFAPMYLLQTWAFIPIGMVMFLIAIYYFRKTGRIYLGAIILAAIGTWLLVTGTVQDPFVL